MLRASTERQGGEDGPVVGSEKESSFDVLVGNCVVLYYIIFTNQYLFDFHKFE